MNTHLETFVPLIYCDIDHTLLHDTCQTQHTLLHFIVIMNFCLVEPLVEKIVKHNSWPIQPDILSPPLLQLTSRKPLWLDLQPVDIKSRWRHNWKSAQVVNSYLVCDPTIQQLVMLKSNFFQNRNSNPKKSIETRTLFLIVS